MSGSNAYIFRAFVFLRKKKSVLAVRSAYVNCGAKIARKPPYPGMCFFFEQSGVNLRLAFEREVHLDSLEWTGEYPSRLYSRRHEETLELGKDSHRGRGCTFTQSNKLYLIVHHTPGSASRQPIFLPSA